MNFAKLDVVFQNYEIVKRIEKRLMITGVCDVGRGDLPGILVTGRETDSGSVPEKNLQEETEPFQL